MALSLELSGSGACGCSGPQITATSFPSWPASERCWSGSFAPICLRAANVGNRRRRCSSPKVRGSCVQAQTGTRSVVMFTQRAQETVFKSCPRNQNYLTHHQSGLPRGAFAFGPWHPGKTAGRLCSGSPLATWPVHSRPDPDHPQQLPQQPVRLCSLVRALEQHLWAGHLPHIVCRQVFGLSEQVAAIDKHPDIGLLA